MADLGIQGNILAFTKNFLQNRKIRVKTNNGQLSSQHALKNGIPQKALYLLSPTLFLLAINSLVKNIQLPVKATLFADDLVVYMRSKNIDTMKEILQKTLDKLNTWSRQTGFQFSTEKTKYTIFSNRKTNINIRLTMNRHLLQPVKAVKFLGVTMDSQLTWREHINNLIASCQLRLNILKTLSNYTWGSDTTSLLRIYKTLIRSKIDYGVTQQPAKPY